MVRPVEVEQDDNVQAAIQSLHGGKGFERCPEESVHNKGDA